MADDKTTPEADASAPDITTAPASGTDEQHAPVEGEAPQPEVDTPAPETAAEPAALASTDEAPAAVAGEDAAPAADAPGTANVSPADPVPNADAVEPTGETPANLDAPELPAAPQSPEERTAVEAVAADSDRQAPERAVTEEVANRLRAASNPENLQRIAAPGASHSKQQCPFKAAGVEYIDYKDTETLKRYINETGKLLPRRMTGVSAKYQRQLTTAIKRARQVALLPFAADNVK